MHVRWLPLILIVGSAAAACTSTSQESSSAPASGVGVPALTGEPDEGVPSAYLFLIEDLPAGFPDFALATCSAEQDGVRGSITAYAGTEQIETEEYVGTPRLTLSVVEKGAESALPRDTVDEVVREGDSNSSFVVDVDGRSAVGFTISAAEPRLTPWPAVAWERNDIVFRLLGEGLKSDDVMAAANSVRSVDREEFESAGRRNDDLC